MNYRHVVFIFVILLCFTKNVYAAVVINEIAWMGTATSVNDEWIELYNSDTTTVSIDEWTLIAADGSPAINLTGSIGANGYYLAERTDDDSVPGITAGVIYSGSLSNTGETLFLKNNTGQVIDTVSMSSGWLSGNSTTKETMQKSGSSWITNTPTPGVQNAATSTTSTTTTTNSDPDEDLSIVTPPQKQKTEKEEWEEIYKKIDPDTNYSVHMIIPDTIVSQVPAPFASEVMKFNILKDLTGKFEWSMGDGQSFVFNKSTNFSYTYKHPGRYIILVNYYSNIFKIKPDSIYKATIDVIPPLITLTPEAISGDITLTNNSTGDIDLHYWNIQTTNSNFTFKSSTILQRNTSVIIPQTVHMLPKNVIYSAQLVTPSGFIIKNTNSSTYKNALNSNNDNDLTKEDQVLFEASESRSSLNKVNSPIIVQFYLIPLVFLVFLILFTFGFHILSKKIENIPENT